MSNDHRVNKPKRAFHGNPNYLDFYNREVKSFFAKEYLGFSSDDKLHISKINNSGAVYYQSDGNFDRRGGSVWTRAEKELFFNCLARFSIHRIDQIEELLPDKNAMEIMNYYNTLKDELIRIRRSERKLKRYKMKISEDKVVPLKFTRHAKSLVRYSKIPAAYEMTEYFIKFEESQSILVSQFERNKTNDENRRFNKVFGSYIGTQKMTVGDKLNEDEHSSSQTEEDADYHQSVGFLGSQEEREPLINCVNALELTNILYIHNMITPLTSRRQIPKLHYKSFVFLENLAKIRLRSIMANVLQKKLMQGWLNQKSIVEEIRIGKSDISNAIQEIDQNHKIPKSLKEYFSNLYRSLGIEVANNFTSQNVLLDDEEYSKFVFSERLTKENKPWKLKDKKSIEPQSSSAEHSEFLVDNNQQVVSMYKGKEEFEVPHISSLTQESSNQTDEHHETAKRVICNLEEKQLEQKDSIKSRTYEHSLLTAMITYNYEKNPMVRESISSEEDGSLLFEKWQNQLKDIECASSPLEGLSGSTSTETFEFDCNNYPNEIDNIQIEMSLLNNFDYEFASYRDSEEIAL